MTEIDRSPTRVASVISLCVAVGTVALTGLYSWFTLILGAFGLLTLAVGVLVGRQAAVTLGSAGIFLGVLFAGVDGAPELVLLVGGVGAVLAWDSASTAIGLGQQLGREAPTTKVELVHVGGTALVGGITIGVAYGIYTIGTGEGSLTAVLFLILGVVLIATALR